jgi:hypothetical protein
MQGARFRQTQEPTSPCLVTRKYPRLTNCMADRVPDSAVSFTWEVFQAARKPVSEAHNTQETPLLAKSIERHALRDK